MCIHVCASCPSLYDLSVHIVYTRYPYFRKCTRHPYLCKVARYPCIYKMVMFVQDNQHVRTLHPSLYKVFMVVLLQDVKDVGYDIVPHCCKCVCHHVLWEVLREDSWLSG